MNDDATSVVIGLLLHAGGLDAATPDLQARIIESIAPIGRSSDLWQARDAYIGVSWLVALGAPEIMQLTTYRMDGTCWKPYTPTARAEVVSASKRVVATVAAFHDTKHEVAPPALLVIGDTYVYRNISGNCVVVDSGLVEMILEQNDIKR